MNARSAPTLVNDPGHEHEHEHEHARRALLRAAIAAASAPVATAAGAMLAAGAALAAPSATPLASAGTLSGRSRPADQAARPLLGFTGITASSEDAVRVPPGYRAQVLVAWGDPVGDMRGMPGFRPDASNSAAEQALQSGMHHDGMHFFPLPLGSTGSSQGLLVVNHEYPDNELLFPDGSRDWSLQKVRKAQAALGCSVQQVRLRDGAWELVRPSRFARRIDANTPMRIGGPAAGAPAMRTARDPSGRRALGTFANCANGFTPWGTYLSCEENFAFQFRPAPDATRLEARYGLGADRRHRNSWGEADPRFDVARNRNEPNHFGWVVEFDPYDPESVPVKRTALGRFVRESATVVELADGRLAIYSGDDSPFEYLYRFVTARPWSRTDRAANRDLLDDGTLYVARLNDDGNGEWIALRHGSNGLVAANGFASQADVLIHARAAGDQVGATRMDRPEWIAHNPLTGELFCSLTNNTKRGSPGREGATPPNPRAPNPFGHIIGWHDDADPASNRLRWRIVALAGQSGALPGDRFASPDGLVVDARGVLWVQTDLSPSRLLRGDHQVFGNNQLLAIDPGSGEVRRFLTGPRGAEITGACFTPDGCTMFVNIQHPGEGGADPGNPRRLSNWPDFRPDGRPRSATVAIRRLDGGLIGS